MLKILGFVFKLLWRVLWLVAVILSLTIGFAWRQTLGRSNVYVPRDWNDRGLGRVQSADLYAPQWDTISGGVQVENPLPLLHAYVWCDKVLGNLGHLSLIHI